VSISKASRSREQRQQPSSHGDSKGSRGDVAGINSGGATKVNAIQFDRRSPARTATAGPRLLAPGIWTLHPLDISPRCLLRTRSLGAHISIWDSQRQQKSSLTLIEKLPEVSPLPPTPPTACRQWRESNNYHKTQTCEADQRTPPPLIVGLHESNLRTRHQKHRRCKNVSPSFCHCWTRTTIR